LEKQEYLSFEVDELYRVGLSASAADMKMVARAIKTINAFQFIFPDPLA
jgi:hypothetical protein